MITVKGKISNKKSERQIYYPKVDIDEISRAEVLREIKIDNEILDLEKIIRDASLELKDLDRNYLLAVKRFQNAMKVALFDGANKMDLKTFEDGFNFYNNALEIVISTGNHAEIEQLKNEFVQTLIKILTTTKNVNNKDFLPFAYRACKSLGEVYDSVERFEISIKFHNFAGVLMRETPLLADFEYFQVVLNYILIGDKKSAKFFSNELKLKQFKTMGRHLIQSFIEKDAEAIKMIKNKVETLGAQRRIDVKPIIYLLDLVEKNIEEKQNRPMVDKIEVLGDMNPFTGDQFNAIKEALFKGIQQHQPAHISIQTPFSAKIDTSSIVSELKDVISSEITKGINSLSNDITSKILNKIPTGTGSISPQRPRSAGFISDDNVPQIEIVEGGPIERPQRPKLDVMLDSVIVSE